MEFIKKYNLQKVGIAVFIIIMFFTILTIVKLIYPGTSTSLYGNRLEGVKSYPIKTAQIDAMKLDLNSTGLPTKITYDLRGKVISIMIDVKKDTVVATAKLLGDKVLAAFTADEKAFYDIQLFIISSDQTGVLYPVIAYKHHTSDIFVWSNNL